MLLHEYETTRNKVLPMMMTIVAIDFDPNIASAVTITSEVSVGDTIDKVAGD